MSALEDQLDVVVDADGAGDPLLHLAVARLQLLQQVVLLRVLSARAAVHLRLVWGGRSLRVNFSQVKPVYCKLCSIVQDETALLFLSAAGSNTIRLHTIANEHGHTVA